MPRFSQVVLRDWHAEFNGLKLDRVLLKALLHRLSPTEAGMTLGPEWDSALVTRLHRVVESLGGSIHESSWGIGGSQEVCTYAIRLPGGRLTATTETYMGLSLRGPAHLVQRIADAMNSNHETRPPSREPVRHPEASGLKNIP